MTPPNSTPYPDEPERHPLAQPNPAQRHALELLSEGMTFAAAGKPLYLSAEGIKSLLRPLRPLWGAKNVTHLVAIALRNGVIK